MNVSKPYTAVTPGADGDVMIALARSTRSRTGRELARLTERSEAGVRHGLRRLVEQGLVDRERAGRAYVYTLNRAHLAAPVVELLAALRTELFDRLRANIQRWEIEPVHASVFGSAARGDGDTSSDIDLFIVRSAAVDVDDSAWRAQLDDLSRAVRDWTGNQVGLAEVSEQDLGRLRSSRPSVTDEIEQDAVHLAGKSIRDLVET